MQGARQYGLRIAACLVVYTQAQLDGSTGSVVNLLLEQSSVVRLAGSTGSAVNWFLEQESIVRLAGSTGSEVNWLL